MANPAQNFKASIAPEIARNLFFRTLAQHIHTSELAQKSLALILIDIRDFRRINRTFGYSCGDYVLAEIQQRISRLAKRPDNITRIGNNEYALILPGLDSPAYVALAISKLQEKLDDPFSWYEKEFKVDFCIGAVTLNAENISAQSLLAQAEIALQTAKAQSLPFHLDIANTEEQNDYNWQLENDLLQALKNHELRLFYQPKLELKTGKPIHAEALLRWQHPEHGNVPPDVVIPILERAGKMLDLTKWVLHSSLRHLKDWPLTHGDMGVAINIPANIIHDRSLREIVSDALNIWGIKPELLTLEITESAVIKDQQSSYNNLEYLKEAGIKIAIDDFGTGYSSLEYFKRIPADELKIDKSFIFNVFEDEADKNIVQLVIDLAHKFNLHVVAEGIENPETLQLLSELGCDYAQGFHISRPIPQDEFIEWLMGYQPKPYNP